MGAYSKPLMKVAALLLVTPPIAGAQTTTCGHLQDLYKSNSCSWKNKEHVVETGVSGLTDPLVPGVMAKHIVLGMAPDYPPYTKFTDTAPKELGGFNKEFADLMLPICGIKVSMMLDSWDQCWTAKPSNIYFDDVTEYVGKGILDGKVHGCTAYTHTKGERELSLEFTQSILSEKKTAGILTRLEDGIPVVSPSLTNYTGIRLGDVTGWAPTADTFVYTRNRCASGSPNFVKTDSLITDLPDGNEAAITALKNGTIDAVYIYSDQVDNLIKARSSLAEGFGTTFAYIHQGLNGWSVNGTTLAISKRGSGLASVLNPCIEKVVQTQEYAEVCKNYPTLNCIPNAFSGTVTGPLHYDEAMDARTDSLTCSDGYCTCSGQ